VKQVLVDLLQEQQNVLLRLWWNTRVVIADSNHRKFCRIYATPRRFNSLDWINTRLSIS
jgi:hypothetical protein